MTLYLEDETGFFENNKALWEQAQHVMEACLDEEKVPYEVEVSVTVVNSDEIHQINLEHRQIDRPTDVLSFPQIDPASNGVILWDDIDHTMVMNLDTENLILGDIVLCDDIAKEQAAAYGHSLEREVCFLIAHSMFHLLGYDHMNEHDEKLMFSKQEKVLEQLSILR
ncbi:MAG: rRNA maturation RNase YbeY [Cellulosilyticaceae bacterium]